MHGDNYLSIRIFYIIAFFAGVQLVGECATQRAHPNIIYILADDLGWKDLGCYGSVLNQTPNIDRLADQGTRFTQAYAMSVCSPTRAATLSGKHAARLKFTIWREATFNEPGGRRPLLDANTIHDLPIDIPVLPGELKKLGYLNFHVGKWHLGDGDHAPQTYGFDVNIGGTHWGAPMTFFHPFSGTGRFGPTFRYVPGLGLGKPGDYLTDRLTEEALLLIDSAGDRPFFLNLCYYSPHTPIEGKDEYVKKFKQNIRDGMRQQNAEYAAMVYSLDENVGRIMQKLDDLNISDHTIVIFASDNGGYIGVDSRSGHQVPTTDNFPLRSGKGSLYEGGIRVPLVIRIPGTDTEGAVCHNPVTCMDIFPTLMDLIGHPRREYNNSSAMDGRSFAILLKNPDVILPAKDLYFHYPHYYPTTSPVSAIRSGRWKLLEFFESDSVELYDLENDLSESTDLSEMRMDIANDLKSRLQNWRQSVDAELPGINSNSTR